MKKIVIAITFLALTFSFSLAQKTATKARSKAVSAATIAKLPRGKTYSVDLTRKGTIYNFTGESTDFSRVAVRTTAGVKTMGELLKESNTDTKGRLAVGMPTDMRGQKLTTVGGSSVNFTCSGLFCGCSGDADCNDMFSGSACGSIAWCNLDTGRCYCVARA